MRATERILAVMQQPLEIRPGSVVYVINPRAGGGGQARTVAEACRWASERAGADAVIAPTRSPDHAAQVAAAADAAGAAAIFGCGGDGTLSGIIQGLPVGSAVALGAMPLGTANVWVDETRIPRQPVRALEAQLDVLNERRGATLWADSGRIHTATFSRRFLLMAGFGLDAAAVAGIVESRRRSRLKRLVGEPIYFFSAVRESIGQAGWPMRMSFDGGPPQDTEIGMFTVGNTRQIGTWLEANPGAVATDGQLDAVLVDAPPWRALALAPFARNGLMTETPGTHHFRFRKVEMWPLGEPPPCQLDGDPGPTGVHTIEVEPQALRVLCPNPEAPVLAGDLA